MKIIIIILWIAFAIIDPILYIESKHAPFGHWYYFLPGSGFALYLKNGSKGVKSSPDPQSTATQKEKN